MKSLSRVRLFAIPWTLAYQAPLSMEFSRQEYWSGLPFPSPGDLPDTGIEPGSPTRPFPTQGWSPGLPHGRQTLLDPGMEPGSPTRQADALPPEPAGKPRVREGEHNVDKILEVLTTNEKPDKFYSISIKKFCLLTL